MRAVNLLPEGAQPRKLSAPPLLPTAGVAAAVLAASVVGVAVHGEARTVGNRQAQLEVLQQRLAQASVASGTPDRNTVSLLSSHDQRLAALNSALLSRIAYDRILRQLALVLPDDVWLDSLSLGSGTTGAAATASTTTEALPVTITGATYTTNSVAGLIQRLSVLPTLKDVGLESAKLQQRGGKDVYQFVITAGVVGGAGS
jgi:Tfp pilus assembly protein PilN